MTALIDADREALRGLGQGQVPAVVEQILTRHLNAAADAIEAQGEAFIADTERTLRGRLVGPSVLAAFNHAADLVRNLAGGAS